MHSSVASKYSGLTIDSTSAGFLQVLFNQIKFTSIFKFANFTLNGY